MMSIRSRFASFWGTYRDTYQNWRYGAIDPAAKLGKRGEQAAAIFLRKAGYVILAEGESDKRGELDLIAVDFSGKQRTIVFVEVKTQASRLPGNPADRVDEDKQRRITQAALRYLKRNHLLEHKARFDVIAIWWQDQDLPFPNDIKHYKNAFEAVGDGQFFC